MTAIAYRLLVALLLFGGLAMFSPARAAQSYDACTGFIDSVPATITTQGVWCLRKNLSTNIINGAAITIATNNVTIDCNDFRVGGLAAGNSSNAIGIRASSRQNATVRNCNIRGFNFGIGLFGGAGHLVEDNRLDNNLSVGILVDGDNSRIRSNAVYDTGGATGTRNAYGIQSNGDIVNNTISGLFADVSDGALFGIDSYGVIQQIRDNTVSGFDMAPAQGGAVSHSYGLFLDGRRQRASGNQVGGDAHATINGAGIYSVNPSYCLDNTVGGFAVNITSNCIGNDNVTLP